MLYTIHEQLPGMIDEQALPEDHHPLPA